MRRHSGWEPGMCGEIIAVSFYEPVVYIHHFAEKQLLKT